MELVLSVASGRLKKPELVEIFASGTIAISATVLEQLGRKKDRTCPTT